MLHYDGDLHLAGYRLTLDSRKRRPHGYVSHAHADHMARHELAFCTPQTAALYRYRLGDRPVKLLPYREAVEWAGATLTTYPAGHVLGSSMLLVEEGGRKLLYTGDFKLDESATAERAEAPKADLLVMECTFGDPKYRLPPRAETISRLHEALKRAWKLGRVPVVFAYELGKAQEATRILTGLGVPVFHSRPVHQIALIYKQLGVDLGNCQLYTGVCGLGTAVVTPPHFHHASFLAKLRNPYRIALTGWAAQPGGANKFEADEVLPLSDHADFDQLLELVRQVQPKIVLTTHGPASFGNYVRELGFEAYPLDRPREYIGRLRELHLDAE